MPDTWHPSSFSIVNLGCKVNRAESDAFCAALESAGLIRVPKNDADLIIVNTCTVTGEADKKSRKAVHNALRANSRAEVIVTGCSSQLQSSYYTDMDARVRAVPRAQLISSLKDHGLSDLRVGPGYPTRVNIKVQDGCDHACTYCIVHVARGPAQSVPLPQALGEVASYFDRGVKEVVLTGIDLGSYSHEGKTLVDLLEGILTLSSHHKDESGITPRVRISSIEPANVTDELVELLATSDGRICRHLHLPLQSGSTRVLSEMDRPYTADEYLELVGNLRAAIPGISLTTDIIAGFPGETEDDFADSLGAARIARFSKIHVFPYSRREGTPAAERPDQISPEAKAARTALLRSLSSELRDLDLEGRMGTCELAIIEPGKGLTESYHEVLVPAGAHVGDLMPITFS